jgi:microcystin-dependent protein
MSNPFVAEIRMFPGTFNPQGWALTNGQLMAISANTALFSLIGINYGGNGTSNFALPDMRSRMPMHQGEGSGLSVREVGQQGGVESVSLQATSLPSSPASPVSASVGYGPQYQTVSPFLVLNFIIALQGFFPSRN